MRYTVLDGSRSLRRGLLATSVAGTVAMLLASPTAPADATFPRLVVALVPLAGLVALEHRRPRTSGRVILGVAAGLLVLAVARPPHGSHDIWSYAMYGRVVVAHHVSPYVHRPSEFASDPALARVSAGWRQARSVYGPGFTTLSAGIMVVAGSSALIARLGFQGVAAVALLAVGGVLVRRRVPAAALAAVLLNPIVVVWVVNGGHNDALVGLSLLLATLALRRARLVAAGVLIAAAVLVKAVAALPAIVAVVWVWRHGGRRAAAVVAVSVACPVVIGYAAFGGPAAIAPVIASGDYQSRVSVWRLVPERATLLPALLGQHVGVLAAMAVVALTAVLVAVRMGEESAAPVLIASLAGYLLLAGYILPWYFAWVLPLAALDGESNLSRLLAVQTVAILLAFQYQSIRNADGLDRFLRSGAAGAQVVAVAGSLALVGAAIAASRRQSSHAAG